MNRILYVPLDERACNYEFPALLAGMTEDVALVEPPVGCMSGWKKCSAQKVLRKRQIQENDA